MFMVGNSECVLGNVLLLFFTLEIIRSRISVYPGWEILVDFFVCPTAPLNEEHGAAQALGGAVFVAGEGPRGPGE